jgi:predicted Zn-dependent protease
VAVAGRKDLTRCANSVLHQSVTAEDALLVARVVREGRIGSSYTHGSAPADAARVLADAAQLARFAPQDPAFRRFPSPAPLPDLVTFVPETDAVGPEERARDLARVFRRAAREKATVAGAYAVWSQELAVANSEGVAVHAPLTSAAVNLVVMSDTASGYASAYSRDVRDIDLGVLAERAVKKCVNGARPRDIEPGDYEVILEPAALAELMEWMTYTSFSARSISEKTSALTGKIGEPVTGANVSIHDDGSDPAGVPVPFDFEGQPKRRLDLIREGVARGFATDSIWSARLGAPPTGHALLKSEEGGDPVPMSLFLASGDVPAASMVGRVERGLLVTRFHYVNGFLDTRRALMTGMTRDGTFLIEGGKIRGAVGNLRFTQGLLEALGDVRAISRERERVPAWWSPATNTAALTMPTLHLGKFHFTGRQER